MDLMSKSDLGIPSPYSSGFLILKEAMMMEQRFLTERLHRDLNPMLRSLNYAPLVKEVQSVLKGRSEDGQVDEKAVEAAYVFITSLFIPKIQSMLQTGRYGADDYVAIRHQIFIKALSGPNRISLEIFDLIEAYKGQQINDTDRATFELHKEIATLALEWLQAESTFTGPLNIILLGESAVGKTSLYRRIVSKKLERKAEITIGADFHEIEVVIEQSGKPPKQLTVRLWDTAGQERHRALTKTYFRNAHGVMIVHDAGKSKTDITDWLHETYEHGIKDVVVFGNKCDLTRDKEPACPEKLTREGYRHYFGSAKTNHNVDAAFKHIVKQCYDRVSLGNKSNEPVTCSSIHVRPTIVDGKRLSSCCK